MTIVYIVENVLKPVNLMLLEHMTIISTAKTKTCIMQDHIFTSKGLAISCFQKTNVKHVQYVSRTVLQMH